MRRKFAAERQAQELLGRSQIAPPREPEFDGVTIQQGCSSAGTSAVGLWSIVATEPSVGLSILEEVRNNEEAFTVPAEAA